MQRCKCLLGLLGLGGSLMGQGARAVPSIPSSQVEEVAQYLARPMETQLPGRSARVRMTTCRVQMRAARPHGRGVIFLYQEQALTTQLNQPYRQRLMKLEADATQQQVISRSFRLHFEKAWVGLCLRSQAQQTIPSSVLAEEVCQVYLRPDPQQAHRYVGATPPAGCPTQFRGAVRITNTVTLDASGMETWDRGFDAAGNQLWGAKSEAYRFRPVAVP